MLARIAMVRALNGGKPKGGPEPRRKRGKRIG
jgi:hypothetical protein